jgi:hypothetical protein
VADCHGDLCRCSDREFLAHSRQDFLLASEVVLLPAISPFRCEYYAPGPTNPRKQRDPMQSGVQADVLLDRLAVPGAAVIERCTA